MKKQKLFLVFFSLVWTLTFSYSTYAVENSETRIEVKGYIQKSEVIATEGESTPVLKGESKEYVLGSQKGRLPKLSDRWFSYLMVLGVIISTISCVLATKGVDKDEEG